MANSVPARTSPPNGVPFGKYTLVRRLGQGAVGTVYEALLPGPLGFAKRVALKRLRAEVVEADPGRVRTLVNEARIGGLLHHDNIVDVLEFDRVGDQFYIAMEFVDGLTLRQIVRLGRQRRTRLPRFAVVALARDICRGLHHAHRLRDRDGTRLGLVHRDLKPSNVIVHRGGAAKVLDFGIAWAASSLLATTTGAALKGTPRYMSPEQITSGGPLTPRSDLFSLGAVLYELATMEVAFPAPSMLALVYQIASVDTDALALRADRALPGLGPILQRALARDPQRRFADAGAMSRALRELAHAYPADASMADVVERLRAVDGGTTPAAVIDAEQLRRDAERPRPASDPDLLASLSLSDERADASGWGRFADRFPAHDTCAELELTETTESLDPPREHPRHEPPAEPAALPGWAVEALPPPDDPTVERVRALPDWAVESVHLLPAWAIESVGPGLDHASDELTPLPDWAVRSLPPRARRWLAPLLAALVTAAVAGGLVLLDRLLAGP